MSSDSTNSGEPKPKLLTLQDFLDNFPFPEIRPKQRESLQQICDAFNSGFKHIVLEAPTGFGKSPVAVCVAKTLGSSYICSATKELQEQYRSDFPYLKSIKGMSGYVCPVREDFLNEGNWVCPICNPGTTFAECPHTSVVYSPCRSKAPGYAPNYQSDDPGCAYKPREFHYIIRNPGTDQEEIFYPINVLRDQILRWGHYDNLSKVNQTQRLSSSGLVPCPYFDQRIIGLLATHTILNYSNFQIFLMITNSQRSTKSDARGLLRHKNLLVLDEGHLIENEVVDFVEISVSRRRLSRYLQSTFFIEQFISSHDYQDDIKGVWVPQLLNILYDRLEKDIPLIKSKELQAEAEEYLDNLEWKIASLESNPDNWVVTEIDRLKFTVKFKPLDVSEYCKSLFEECPRTLIMSATILDVNTFCRNVGLPRNEVKFITMDSDFPPENRPIHALNTVYLNYTSIKNEDAQRSLAAMIDKIMDKFSDSKGIIHTTSYEQVRFIQRFLSVKNAKRLIPTDPQVERESIVSNHFNNKGPTVLISPSMRLGLDLKDERSRFQIIVKVPYPSKGDRWTDKKREKDSAWYNWQTALALVQAYGRSVRSKDDWAFTFILDSAFDGFVKRNRLPNWFIEAIKRN